MNTLRLLGGIRRKLVMAFSFLLTGGALGVVLYLPARLQREAMSAMVSKAEAIRDMSAYSAAAGLIFNDTAAVHEVLAGAAAGDSVVRVLMTRKVSTSAHGVNTSR